MAQEFYFGNTDEAHKKATNNGWELIGADGAGRRVYRVSAENQVGPVVNPVHEAPCVVKFAKKHPRFPGTDQNIEEIEQWEQVKELESLEEPVFVPVADHANDDLWVSMPEVDADGGSIPEVKDRLSEKGWICADLSDDNIGEMHDLSVVLDYGIDCITEQSVMDEADEMKSQLEELKCQNIDQERHDHDTLSFTWDFEMPDWVLPDIDKEGSIMSTIVMKAMVGIRKMDLYFGPYGDVNVHEPAERIVDENGWLGTRLDAHEWGSAKDDDIYARIIVDSVGSRNQILEPDLAGDLLRSIFDDANRFLPDPAPAPTNVPDDVNRAVTSAIDDTVADAGVSGEAADRVEEAIEDALENDVNWNRLQEQD